MPKKIKRRQLCCGRRRSSTIPAQVEPEPEPEREDPWPRIKSKTPELMRTLSTDTGPCSDCSCRSDECKCLDASNVDPSTCGGRRKTNPNAMYVPRTESGNCLDLQFLFAQIMKQSGHQYRDESAHYFEQQSGPQYGDESAHDFVEPQQPPIQKPLEIHCYDPSDNYGYGSCTNRSDPRGYTMPHTMYPPQQMCMCSSNRGNVNVNSAQGDSLFQETQTVVDIMPLLTQLFTFHLSEKLPKTKDKYSKTKTADEFCCHMCHSLYKKVYNDEFGTEKSTIKSNPCCPCKLDNRVEHFGKSQPKSHNCNNLQNYKEIRSYADGTHNFNLGPRSHTNVNIETGPTFTDECKCGSVRVPCPKMSACMQTDHVPHSEHEECFKMIDSKYGRLLDEANNLVLTRLEDMFNPYAQSRSNYQLNPTVDSTQPLPMQSSYLSLPNQRVLTDPEFCEPSYTVPVQRNQGASYLNTPSQRVLTDPEFCKPSYTVPDQRYQGPSYLNTPSQRVLTDPEFCKPSYTVPDQQYQGASYLNMPNRRYNSVNVFGNIRSPQTAPGDRRQFVLRNQSINHFLQCKPYDPSDPRPAILNVCRDRYGLRRPVFCPEFTTETLVKDTEYPQSYQMPTSQDREYYQPKHQLPRDASQPIHSYTNKSRLEQPTPTSESSYLETYIEPNSLTRATGKTPVSTSSKSNLPISKGVQQVSTNDLPSQQPSPKSESSYLETYIEPNSQTRVTGQTPVSTSSKSNLPISKGVQQFSTTNLPPQQPPPTIESSYLDTYIEPNSQTRATGNPPVTTLSHNNPPISNSVRQGTISEQQQIIMAPYSPASASAGNLENRSATRSGQIVIPHRQITPFALYNPTFSSNQQVQMYGRSDYNLQNTEGLYQPVGSSPQTSNDLRTRLMDQNLPFQLASPYEPYCSCFQNLPLPAYSHLKSCTCKDSRPSTDAVDAKANENTCCSCSNKKSQTTQVENKAGAPPSQVSLTKQKSKEEVKSTTSVKGNVSVSQEKKETRKKSRSFSIFGRKSISFTPTDESEDQKKTPQKGKKLQFEKDIFMKRKPSMSE